MNQLPSDLHFVIVNTLLHMSKVSVIVFAHCSKNCYRVARRCAHDNRLERQIIGSAIAREGLLSIFKWALDNKIQIVRSDIAVMGPLVVSKWTKEWKMDTYICAYAAENGHLDVLQWAREIGCTWNSNTCAFAAKNGHFNILKWARENGCGWNSWVNAHAATIGRLDILQWALENGCDWHPWALHFARKHNHNHILEWATENGYDDNMFI